MVKGREASDSALAFHSTTSTHLARPDYSHTRSGNTTQPLELFPALPTRWWRLFRLSSSKWQHNLNISSEASSAS